MKTLTWKMMILLLTASIVLLALACASPAATTVTTSTTTVVQYSDPWPGVPVYRDSNSPIKTRVNETFAIILPPAPLFGWGWQNQDLTTFTLLETKTVPGADNPANPYGLNAFLFKTLKNGTYQIILYVASKPPQQTVLFDVVVSP